MRIFEEIESEVMSYGRAFPRIFTRANAEYIWDEEGNQYYPTDKNEFYDASGDKDDFNSINWTSKTWIDGAKPRIEKNMRYKRN